MSKVAVHHVNRAEHTWTTGAKCKGHGQSQEVIFYQELLSSFMHVHTTLKTGTGSERSISIISKLNFVGGTKLLG